MDDYSKVIWVLVLSALFAVCCFVFYDWKLFLTLMIFGTAMNLENSMKREE